jgi:hypothetical protein
VSETTFRVSQVRPPSKGARSERGERGRGALPPAAVGGAAADLGVAVALGVVANRKAAHHLVPFVGVYTCQCRGVPSPVVFGGLAGVRPSARWLS